VTSASASIEALPFAAAEARAQLGWILERCPSAVAQVLADDCVVLDLGSGRVYGLGPVGAFVWSRLDGERTLAELAPEIRDRFDVLDAEVEEDLLRFARELLRSGLATPHRP
jgi:hypothetical protein